VPTAVIDRRAALKARHRAAILHAAQELIVERSGPRFSVDELAERADVARRTVFNHFASLDEVILTLAGDVLAVLVDEFTAAVAAMPVGDGTRASMFDELAATLRSADLVAAIVALNQLVGADDDGQARRQALTQEAFARVGGSVAHEVERRNPAADPLDVELLVSSLINGLVVIASRWVTDGGAAAQPEARAAWERLLTRLLDSVRNGYLHTP